MFIDDVFDAADRTAHNDLSNQVMMGNRKDRKLRLSQGDGVEDVTAGNIPLTQLTKQSREQYTMVTINTLDGRSQSDLDIDGIGVTGKEDRGKAQNKHMKKASINDIFDENRNGAAVRDMKDHSRNKALEVDVDDLDAMFNVNVLKK